MSVKKVTECIEPDEMIEVVRCNEHREIRGEVWLNDLKESLSKRGHKVEISRTPTGYLVLEDHCLKCEMKGGEK